MRALFNLWNSIGYSSRFVSNKRKVKDTHSQADEEKQKSVHTKWQNENSVHFMEHSIKFYCVCVGTQNLCVRCTVRIIGVVNDSVFVQT